MFAALHETAHGTAFRSKKMNQWAARLAGIAHLYPSGIFRELHFTHHRHTHIPGLDPEISLGNRPAPVIITNLPLYLSWLTGLPILLFKIIMLLNGALGMPEPIRMNLYPFIKPEKRYKIMLDSWLVLAVHGVFLYLALFVNTGFWALFTGQVVGHCFLAFYVSMEHNGLPHEGNIFDKTRSIRAYVWVKWLMWNMPYHAEHHAYPAVPFHALPALHKQLQEELKHQGETHVKFHLKTLGNLVKVK
jgi:fatty acid desaturase